jgi:predicted transglutaminase-like cysteine proteinase
MRHVATQSLLRASTLWWGMLLCMSISLASGFLIDHKLLSSIENRHGLKARMRVESWDSLMKMNKSISVMEKLQRVNRFFNNMTFVDDAIHWKKRDYWATPIEFLATNGGDCEDFSLAKYFTLKEVGIPASKLKLTYVKALKINQAHMVVTYFETPSSEPLVLDNLVKEIRPSSSRTDLLPVYSFNGDGLWLAKQRGEGKFVGKSDRISLWKDLKKRMRTIYKESN